MSDLIKKVKEYCKDEIEINEEHPWDTITDGTGDICRGRLEFAKGLLDNIKKWEEANEWVWKVRIHTL